MLPIQKLKYVKEENYVDKGGFILPEKEEKGFSELVKADLGSEFVFADTEGRT